MTTGASGRVLILTQYYAPEPNFITYDVAHKLAETANVTVITAFANYPLGRFYDGRAHWLPAREREGNVTVWRVPMVPDHSASKLRRLVSYGSFAMSSMLVALFVAGAPRVVWVYQTPFILGVVGAWFKLFHDSKLVFTYADLWPESFLAAAVSKPGWLVDQLFRFRRWINRYADVIIGSTKGTIQQFAREGVPQERLHYVPVWVQGIGEPGAASAAVPPSIVYAGNIGPGQHLEPVIEAAAQLLGDGSAVRFDFYGSGSNEERLKALATELGADNVHFHGRVTSEEAFRASSDALAQLVTLRPDPMFAMTIPSKLPFCIAAGAPVLYSLEGEAARVAEESGAGFGFDGRAPSTLVNRIREILALTPVERAALRERLRSYYHAEFEREVLMCRHEHIVLADGPHA